jgi:hypothetical protein
MPRYYFHVTRGRVTILDQRGTDLLNTGDAEMAAAQRAEEIVAREGPNATRADNRRIVISDDNWETLFELPF